MAALVESIIMRKDLQPFLAVLKGARNGAVYGAKIRAPHALVMTFLFRDGSFESKIRSILRLTFEHARNLFKFVTIYKSLMLAQRLLRGGEENAHSFLAGVVGGWIVFGDYTSVNNQIVLYLLSRIIVGLARLAVKRGWVTAPANAFTPVAALVWGIVMWLFRHDRDTLQPSLASSMQYLYNDSERWTGLKTFLWHNK